MTTLNSDWVDVDFSKDLLRTMLKDAFFNYKSSWWLSDGSGQFFVAQVGSAIYGSGLNLGNFP